ncbi:MAG: DUF3597 domain-containing protein [Clostridiales bacterium]|nr:DUF3597 domain-containing protein [Clostridiales bacterium]
MSQMKWVFIMVMIVIVALGVLVFLLLYDGGAILDASPTQAPTPSPAGAPSEATQNPGQSQPAPTPTAAAYVFQVYDDAPVHYGDIAYMGNQNNGDDGSMVIDTGCTDNPHSGVSCIRITYDPPSAGHWAGMMWLSGANNFPPNLPVDGVDAARASRLTFYARGLGSTKFFIENEQKQQVTLNVQLPSDWTQYTLAVPSDWEQVCVGFGFASNAAAGKSTIYLDDIALSN